MYQSNMYSVWKRGRSINTNFNEMEQFLGIMSVLKLPAFAMYWSSTTRYDPIADMSRNRYQDIRLHLYANDNSKRDAPENKDNNIFKVEPVVEGVR